MTNQTLLHHYVPLKDSSKQQFEISFMRQQRVIILKSVKYALVFMNTVIGSKTYKTKVSRSDFMRKVKENEIISNRKKAMLQIFFDTRYHKSYKIEPSALLPAIWAMNKR